MKRLVLSTLSLVFLLGILGAAVQPVAAQSGLNWNAQFFNNAYLIGPAAASTQVSSVNFDWGAGAPVQGVNADNFSVRFSTSTTFAAGTYRFWLLADDGVHLWIDNKHLIIDSYDKGAAGQLLQADFTLTAGTHNLQVDFREAGGNAYIKFSFANLATNPTGPSFSVPATNTGTSTPVTTGVWTANYFNNKDLSGSPVAILSEASPTHNWASSAPLSNLSADNFSARWTAQLQLSGNYRIDVQADDGVRVYVDGTLYINEWHDAQNKTYSANLTLSSGLHTVTVEYYENGGAAFITFNLSQVTSTPTTNNPPANTGAYAVVTTGMLNVRDYPNPISGNVVTKIPRGTTATVIGRLADNSWWQVTVNGVTGWLSGRFVAVTNAQIVPVVNPPSVNAPVVNTQPTGYALIVRGNLNVRRGPGVNFGILGRIPNGNSAQIIARNSTSTWWYVNFNGVIGWVSGAYVTLPQGINLAAVPVQ